MDRNPRYSLRSFAAALGVNSSDLSQILSGKRSVSTKVAERIFQFLELTPVERKQFLESILAQKKEKGLKRISPALLKSVGQISKAMTAAPAPGATGIGLDMFRVIADWYHTAICELTMLDHFKADPRWIARELNISTIEAKLAFDRLLELGIIEKVGATYRKTNLQFDTKDKSKTSAFHRKRQRQVLEKSIYSLENDPIEERNHSSLTLCLDPKRIPEAKEKIQKLIWELGQFLINGEPERVYELNINLFPLQRKLEKKR